MGQVCPSGAGIQQKVRIPQQWEKKKFNFVCIKTINLISVHWLLNDIKYYLIIIMWNVIITCLILKSILKNDDIL